MRRLILLLAVGCSSDPTEPVVEYPPEKDAGSDAVTHDVEPDAAADAGADAADAFADAVTSDADASVDAGPWTPPTREQLLTGSVFIEGATSDGHLVFDVDGDLMAWPASELEPALIVQDYSAGSDSMRVRGRFVGAWLGMDATPPLTLWSLAGGVETIGPTTRRDALVARPAANELVYFTTGSDSLHVDVHATGAQQGAGIRVVADLDTALIESNCRIQVAYETGALLVAGCPEGGTSPQLGAYDLAGNGLISTILGNSAPGFWLNNARSSVVAQTVTEAKLLPVSGTGTEVTLTGPVKQVRFSADDTLMVYLTATGDSVRSVTSTPPTPTTLTQAGLIVGRSDDLDYVIVANDVDSNNRSDSVLVDTAGATGTQELAPERALFVGFSQSTETLVYLSAMEDLLNQGVLRVMTLPDGQPVVLSDNARRVTFDGHAVYWFEQELGQFTAELKAAVVSDPSTVYGLGADFNGLTVHAQVVGETLFVATKDGLWRYE